MNYTDEQIAIIAATVRKHIETVKAVGFMPTGYAGTVVGLIADLQEARAGVPCVDSIVRERAEAAEAALTLARQEIVDCRAREEVLTQDFGIACAALDTEREVSAGLLAANQRIAQDLAEHEKTLHEKDELNREAGALIKELRKLHGDAIREANTIADDRNAWRAAARVLESRVADGEIALTLNAYQYLAQRTAVYPGKGEVGGLAYAALGLAGESGEVAEKVKKLLRDAAGVLDDARRQAIKKELGDVLWYVAAVAAECMLTLDAVARANVDKLADRKERGTLKGEGDNR